MSEPSFSLQITLTNAQNIQTFYDLMGESLPQPVSKEAIKEQLETYLSPSGAGYGIVLALAESIIASAGA